MVEANPGYEAAAATQIGPPRRALLRWATRLIVVAVGSRAIVLLAAWVAEKFVARNPNLVPGDSAPLLQSLTSWDGWWYLGIVRDGYHSQALIGGYHDYAFLPLYPALVRLLSEPFPGYEGLIAVILSNLLFGVSLALLVLLGTRHLSDSVAFRAAALLAIFPFSAVFSMAYAESLFMVLMLGALLAAETRRPVVAGVLLALATLTRLQGIVLLIPIAMLLWKEDRPARPAWLALLLGPAAAMAALGWVVWLTGDVTSYGAAQGAWGREGLGGDPAGSLAAGLTSSVALIHVVDLATLILAVFLLVFLRGDRIPVAYSSIPVLFLGVVFASGSIQSIGRLLMPAFPYQWVLAARRGWIGKICLARGVHLAPVRAQRRDVLGLVRALTPAGSLRLRLGPWLLAGAFGWAGLIWIGWMLWQNDPPRAGFDLTLLLDAARNVLSGQSPYDPAILAGASPDAVSLFYSYPPPVAQAMTLLAWLPDGVALILWGCAATLALGFVASRLAIVANRDPARTAIQAMCVAPLVFPFAIAVLFGNLDVWYPLAYGVVLLAVLPDGSTRMRILSGVALGTIIVAKLQPAPILLWLIVLAWLPRGRPQSTTVMATVVTGVVIVAASLLMGGVQPWLDYAQVVAAGAGADLVDPRNIGPVSLIGQLTGADGGILRWVQVVVFGVVLVTTVIAAGRVGDLALSFAIVATVSLVTLPVTWFHYPVALLPIAILVAIVHRPSRALVVLAAAVAAIAIAWLPMTWLAVAILLVAVWRAAQRSGTPADAAPVPAA